MISLSTYISSAHPPVQLRSNVPKPCALNTHSTVCDITLSRSSSFCSSLTAFVLFRGIKEVPVNNASRHTATAFNENKV